MKKITIEQQELLQQMIQNNNLREITPFKALEMIKKQVGNIHVFTDEMPPQQTSVELRNSGLFEIIEQAFDEYLILQKMRAEYKAIEEKIGISLITLFSAIENGVWVKTKNGISHHFTVSVRKWLQTNTYCLYYRPYTHVWFENYGKTWALTREELEK